MEPHRAESEEKERRTEQKDENKRHRVDVASSVLRNDALLHADEKPDHHCGKPK